MTKPQPILASESDCPLEIFKSWFESAKNCGLKYPDAMTLATVDDQGHPDARIVLLKEFDERGFVFYTNLNSQKGKQLKDHPNASLCLYWMPMERQIRIKGTVEQVTDEQADAYFASRPRNSQIGAWASKQSQTIQSPLEFEKRIAKKLAKYSLGKVPRPSFWSGFRLIPTSYEFWEDRPFRLHERWRFHLEKNASWRKQKLFP